MAVDVPVTATRRAGDTGTPRTATTTRRTFGVTTSAATVVVAAILGGAVVVVGATVVVGPTVVGTGGYSWARAGAPSASQPAAKKATAAITRLSIETP